MFDLFLPPQRAIETDPSNPQHTRRYATVLASEKQFWRAETLFLRSLQLDPTNADTLYAYAKLLWQPLKEPTLAMALLNCVLHINSLHCGAAVVLAEIRWKEYSDARGAQKILMRGLVANPDSHE